LGELKVKPVDEKLKRYKSKISTPWKTFEKIVDEAETGLSRPNW
jgi:hypothetical protein